MPDAGPVPDAGPDVPTGDGRAGSGLRDRLRHVRIDVTPLRTSAQFRLLYVAGSVSFLGSMVTYIAIPLQVKQLTGSALAVGLVGAAELLPLIVFGLWGGALADWVDRRTMVWLTEMAFAALTLTLLVNALLPEPQVWVLYVVAALAAAVDGLQRPSLDALLPRLVPPDQIPAAVALNSLRMTVGMIAGPALGGVVAATAGVAAAYGLDLATFAVSVVLLGLMAAVPPSEQSERPSLRGIGEAVRYAAGRQELLGTYAVDTVAMMLAFPNALFPFLADALDRPAALGLLYAAPSVGALLATLGSGWTSRYHRHGRAVAVAAAVWGLAVAAAGLAPTLWLALVALAVSGAADMVSGLFRATIWNQTIPDEMRGRLAGIELLSYAVGPTVGQIRAGAVAQRAGVRASLVSGGLLCVAAVGATTAWLGQFRAYDDRTNPHAVRERQVRAARAAEASGA